MDETQEQPVSPTGIYIHYLVQINKILTWGLQGGITHKNQMIRDSINLINVGVPKFREYKLYSQNEEPIDFGGYKINLPEITIRDAINKILSHINQEFRTETDINLYNADRNYKASHDLELAQKNEEEYQALLNLLSDIYYYLDQINMLSPNALKLDDDLSRLKDMLNMDGELKDGNLVTTNLPSSETD